MGQPSKPPVGEPSPTTRDFYLRCIDAIEEARVPYVIGGGYAMACYTGIARDTKDLDIFVRPQDRDTALRALQNAGFRTELTWPHFLAKAMAGDDFIDVLYNSGNGLCPVDDEWFSNAVEKPLLGRPVPLCPVEEIIWSKAFVQDRERFDGADVTHLILRRGEQMNWHRLLRRFDGHDRVLLAHLILFGYAYPSQRRTVPQWVLEELARRIEAEPQVDQPICRGTFMSQRQYLTAVDEWGFADGRLKPLGPLSAEEIEQFKP